MTHNMSKDANSFIRRNTNDLELYMYLSVRATIDNVTSRR